MISPITIAKIQRFKNLYLELKEQMGAIEIEANHHLGDVHLTLKDFLMHFTMFEISDFGEPGKYPDTPHLFTATFEGVKFFAIGKSSEVHEMFLAKEIESFVQEVAAHA